MNKKLESIYLDWVNNYLSTEKFGEDYGLTSKETMALIDLLRVIYKRHYQ